MQKSCCGVEREARVRLQWISGREWAVKTEGRLSGTHCGDGGGGDHGDH